VSINLSILSAGVVEARQSVYKRECRGVAESTKSDEGRERTGGGGG
jgi:hypothetical protein